MSLAAQNVAPQAVAAPGQLLFPFAWRCDDPTTVKVWVNDVQDGGFAVALNADQTAAPGGSITRAVACFGGEVVTVERTSPQTQTTSLVRYGPFPADTVTSMLDKAVMLLQEVAAVALLKGIRAARSTLAKYSTLELPTPTLGSLLQWADGGGGLLKLDNVDLVTLAAAREVTGEAVNRTGVGLYQLAHTPSPLARVKLYLNGGRLTLGTHYTITVAGLITQQAGFVSDPAEVLLADYTW
jgi:hypothetical protein